MVDTDETFNFQFCYKYKKILIALTYLTHYKNNKSNIINNN